MARRVLDFSGELPTEGIPPMRDLPISSFFVQRAISAVLREDHIVHVEGIIPLIWQKMPYERAGGNTEIQDYACQGLTILPPEGNPCRLGLDLNISEESRILFPLLASRLPPYDKALGCL